MCITLLLLGVLGATAALKDGSTTTIKPLIKEPRGVPPFVKEPRGVPPFVKEPRGFPQFKLPSFDARTYYPTNRNTVACSKKLTTTTLSPGESIDFTSPNYPSDYNKKSNCKWAFKSTEDISITCSDFELENASKRGKCKDALIIGKTKFCGSSAPNYSAGTSVKVMFKSNKKKNFGGFNCTATAGGSSGTTTTPAPGDCTCGQVNRASRIVNGTETEVNEYPWQAAMVYKGSSSVFCGASVIGSKHILTAAHCTQAVEDYKIKYQVLLGAHGLTSSASSEERFNAVRYIQNKDYDSSTYDNDIAIIVIDGSIDFTSSQIRPVCLPDNDSDDYDSVTATVSGWGTLESGGSQPDVLMEVDVPTMSNSDCMRSYGNSITANMLCAGYDEGLRDSCQGDSGGPLIYYSGSGYTQIGVVSWGFGCASPGYPGVYARVTQYLSLISKNSASSTTCSAA